MADALLESASRAVQTPAILMTPALILALALAVARPDSVATPADSVRADVEVRATVLRHTTDVRRCYQEEGLRRNPSLAGELELALTILPTGHVNEVTVPTTSLAGPGQKEVAVCIATRARNWRFQRGPYAIETVVFPFVLSPEEASKVQAASNSTD
jgi:hypothetical protein